MRSNEKGLFIYNAHTLVNTSPYSGILTPTFVFLIRSYLPHSPATAGSFKGQPVLLMTAEMVTVEKRLSCPRSHNKNGFKAVDLAKFRASVNPRSTELPVFLSC